MSRKSRKHRRAMQKVNANQRGMQTNNGQIKCENPSLLEGAEEVMRPSISMDNIPRAISMDYRHEWLVSTWLTTETAYQRDIEMEQVEKILANFDHHVVNDIKVSNRDGKFYVFDGAHTLCALKIRANNQPVRVPCKVYEGLTFEEEAYLFALQNGDSKAVAAKERLRAMLLSNSEDAVGFRDTTEYAGFKLADDRSSNADNKICALDTAYKLYKYDRNLYLEVLMLLRDIWDGEKSSLHYYMIGGVGKFLKVYGGEYNRDRFIKKLTGVEPRQIHNAAGLFQGKTADIKHAKAILQLYNKGGRGALDESKLGPG